MSPILFKYFKKQVPSKAFKRSRSSQGFLSNLISNKIIFYVIVVWTRKSIYYIGGIKSPELGAKHKSISFILKKEWGGRNRKVKNGL